MASLPKKLLLLKHLHELGMSDVPDIPGELMPKVHRDAAFRAFGLQPEKTGALLRQRIVQQASARRLAAARVARAEGQARHELKAEEIAKGGVDLRAHVERLLERLALNQPELAAVYCRKYEQASEKDIASLKEDLLLLQELEEKGPSDELPPRA